MSVQLLERASRFGPRIAITDSKADFTYKELLAASRRVANALLEDRDDLEEQPVAFMVTPGFDYVATLCGIWAAGGIAVPLCLSHPAPELEYVLEDTGASIVVVDAPNHTKVSRFARARKIRLVRTRDALRSEPTAEKLDIRADRGALILYTSGTTNRPKGVVSTHDNLRSQMESLVEAWDWKSQDRVLHVLPLHHTHGIVNVLLCALWVGAACEMQPGFDAERVWQRFGSGGLTLFMAVPTIYVKLIAAWEQAQPKERVLRSDACHRFRLMVSGSAALPLTTFQKWRALSGHKLLERYGMTEIGMALSNPLQGDRRPGTVGQPLPGVEVRLADEEGNIVEADAVPGEIQVRGPTVFREYWQQPDATRDAFIDGWFRTGDVAVIEDGYYRILGRSSVDIIKSGGYKISALEIEEVLRSHPEVQDCAVVGIEDAEWGEVVSAAIVARSANHDEVRDWLAERLAPYKVPRRWITVDELPRNAMGKVTKPDIKRLFT